MYDPNSPYYIQTAYGGYSPCIQGNNAYGLRPFAGSVLPNCVGFIVGAFNERLALGACTWLGSVNARNLLSLAQSQGLPTGNDAVAGGVICWWSADAGHAAFIDSVVDANTVITKESGWTYTTGPIIRTYTRHRTGGAWQFMSGYTYQGVIYPPGTPPQPGVITDEELGVLRCILNLEDD